MVDIFEILNVFLQSDRDVFLTIVAKMKDGELASTSFCTEFRCRSFGMGLGDYLLHRKVVVFFFFLSLVQRREEKRREERRGEERRGEERRGCLLYTSPSPREGHLSRMPSSA